jgi:hypothetical protein
MKKSSQFLILFISIISFSCTHSETNSLNKNFNNDVAGTLIYEKVDSLLSISDSEMIIRNQGNNCDVNHRQILHVDSFAIVNSNYRINNTNDPVSERRIYLLGKPTGSSCELLTQAYLHFVSDKKLIQNPIFQIITQNNGSKYAEIRLFYPEEYFDAIQFKLMNSKNIYCWWGLFPGGMIYGDIEINRKIPLNKKNK